MQKKIKPFQFGKTIPVKQIKLPDNFAQAKPIIELHFKQRAIELKAKLKREELEGQDYADAS